MPESPEDLARRMRVIFDRFEFYAEARNALRDAGFCLEKDEAEIRDNMDAWGLCVHKTRPYKDQKRIDDATEEFCEELYLKVFAIWRGAISQQVIALEKIVSSYSITHEKAKDKSIEARVAVAPSEARRICNELKDQCGAYCAKPSALKRYSEEDWEPCIVGLRELFASVDAQLKRFNEIEGKIAAEIKSSWQTVYGKWAVIWAVIATIVAIIFGVMALLPKNDNESAPPEAAASSS